MEQAEGMGYKCKQDNHNGSKIQSKTPETTNHQNKTGTNPKDNYSTENRNNLRRTKGTLTKNKHQKQNSQTQK